MNVFMTSFMQILTCLFFAIPGFLLAKANKASEKHLSTLSAILIYGCGPFMIINSFYQAATQAKAMGLTKLELGLSMLEFAGISLLLQILFIAIILFIFRHKLKDNKYRILTIGSVLGNVGFFGLPLVETMIPNQPIVLCYSSVFTATMNILVFTIGIYCLTNDKSYISIKQAVVNPTSIAIYIAIIIYILADYLNPNNYTNVLWNAVALLGKITTPLCMLILGIRLASVNFLDLFKRPFIYAISILKLIIFPLFGFAFIYFIPSFDYTFKASVILLSAVPCASVILNMAEIHHKEEELAANCVLITTLLCILTIPIISLLLNIL